MTLLGREGPENFSASALAKAAKVSKATLFHHFSSINQIPLAAFEHVWLQTLSDHRRRNMRAHAYIKDLGREVVSIAERRRDFLSAYFVFFTKAIFEASFRDRFHASSKQMHQAMTAALGAKLPENLSASDIEARIRLIEMALDGLALHLLVTTDARKLRSAWDLFAEVLSREK